MLNFELANSYIVENILNTTHDELELKSWAVRVTHSLVRIEL